MIPADGLFLRGRLSPLPACAYNRLRRSPFLLSAPESHLKKGDLPLNAKYKGVLCILSAAFFFALMGLFVRLAGDLPAMQKSFFRNLVAMGAAAVLLFPQPPPGPSGGRQLGGTCSSAPPLVRWASCAISTQWTIWSWLTPLCSTEGSSPFFAILFSFFLLRERISLFQAVSVLTAFCGCLLIVRPSGQAMEPLRPGGPCRGRLRGPCLHHGPAAEQAGGGRALHRVLLLRLLLCGRRPYLIFCYHPMTGRQLLFLLLAGAAAAGGQFSITAAYSYAPARELSVYDYSQILFSALLGFLVFHQVPDLLSWLGYLIICGAAVAMFLHTRRQAG